jgi:hypothetical protein
MAQAQQQGIALNIASQGGLIDDRDVEFIDVAFCEYDYAGSIDHNILALAVQMQDEEGKTYDQYYSAGELTYFVPSDDGAMAVPVADKQQLTDSCNAWKFLASMLECDNRMNDILATGNVKNLIGLKAHVKQHAQPKRQGLIRGGKNADREPTVLLVSAILALPGEGAPATTKKAGIAGAGKPVAGRPAQAAQAAKPGLGGKGAQARTVAPAGKGTKPNGGAGVATPAAGDDDKALATDILLEILTTDGGAVPKTGEKGLSKRAFQVAGERVQAGQLATKDKTRIVQLIFLDTFLHELAQAGTVEYDGATVSLPS